MNALVVYHSVHGNTRKIAEAVGRGLGESRVVSIDELNWTDLSEIELLVVGAPTYGGRPTEPIQDFLKNLEDHNLEGVKVTGFDTRLTSGWVKIFGFAAGKIGKALEGKDGTLVMEAEGFFVKGGKGPLRDGEETRAESWGKAILAAASKSA